MTRQTWIVLWSTAKRDEHGEWDPWLVDKTIIDRWSAHETLADAISHYQELCDAGSDDLYAAHVAMVVDGDGDYDTQLWKRCQRMLAAADTH